MGIWGKESHLSLRITAVGAVCVGLDEFTDGETVRGFLRRDGAVLAHELFSLFDSLRKSGYSSADRGSRSTSIPNVPNSRPWGLTNAPSMCCVVIAFIAFHLVRGFSVITSRLRGRGPSVYFMLHCAALCFGEESMDEMDGHRAL